MANARFLVVALGTLTTAALPLSPAGAQTAGLVDDRRLLAAATESQNWILHARDYGNQRFSPLAEISRGNVATLRPSWTYKTGVTATFQATPIVVDGVMYVSEPYDHVAALDAGTGAQLWRYEHKRVTQDLFGGPANRGVAVGYGLVYVATVDARLVALDQKSGEIVWDIALGSIGQVKRETREALGGADPLRGLNVAGTSGIGANMAPILYKGLVFVGITGAGYGLHLDDPRAGAPQDTVVGIAGDYGRLGYMAAFDAKTGKEAWHFDMAPTEGWEGPFQTATADGVKLMRDVAAEKAALASFRDAWRTGGGSALTTPAIDPDLGLLYFGTGSPSPQLEDRSRPGDNLYTSSLVALDLQTGKLRWYYQQVPHDIWGYEVSSPAVLFDLPWEGRTVKAVGEAGKTGWFYVHDRVTGEFLFKSDSFIPQENMFAHPTPAGVKIAPGKWGGASWSPVSYDTGTGLLYVTGLHAPLRYAVKSIPAQGNLPEVRYSTTEPSGDPNWGTLTALDLRDRGRIRWQQKLDTPQVGGVLATSGGLVFTGEGNGWFKAFDAATGKLLWQYQASAGVNAPPIAYEVDGTQFIAVAAGGNSLFRFKTGEEVIAFALPK